jgi:uncharacterized protein (AIM24 family)
MRDQLLGATQPVLSISLDPGESVVAGVGRFAWMTDSIEMAAADEAKPEPRLCAYTATGEPGVVAFASRFPGCIVSVDIGSGYEGCLVRESSFLAGTPGVQVAADSGPVTSGPPDGDRLVLWRIGGTGRAWVELPGDVVRRELTAGQSLRAHPGHIGMFDTTITIQVTQVRDIAGRDDPYPCAVLSGPGAVWLRSMHATAGSEGGTTARSA